LQTQPSIVSLDLGNTGLRTDAVVAIATALHHNDRLQELSLENPRTFSKTVRLFIVAAVKAMCLSPCILH
jgi:hypothetical protein